MYAGIITKGSRVSSHNESRETRVTHPNALWRDPFAGAAQGNSVQPSRIASEAGNVRYRDVARHGVSRKLHRSDAVPPSPPECFSLVAISAAKPGDVVGHSRFHAVLGNKTGLCADSIYFQLEDPSRPLRVEAFRELQPCFGNDFPDSGGCACPNEPAQAARLNCTWILCVHAGPISRQTEHSLMPKIATFGPGTPSTG